MRLAAAFIHHVKEKMGGKLVLHGYGTLGVQRERHERRIREVEGNARTFHHSAGNITPHDVEKPSSGCRSFKAVGYLDRLVPFDRLRQQELVCCDRSAQWIGGGHEQRYRLSEPRRNKASRSIVCRIGRKPS